MTSKDFMFIANVISNLRRDGGERMRAAQAFADDLRITNPRFNERMFMDACRVPQMLIPAHRVKTGDFIPQWGTVDEIQDNGETILIRTDTCTEDEWAMDCDRNEPVRIERLNGSHIDRAPVKRHQDFITDKDGRNPRDPYTGEPLDL